MPTLKQNINKPERLKEQVAREAFRFVENKKTISYLDTENKKIRPTLEKYVADKGSVDSNGSSAAVIEYADKLVVLKQTCRNRASVLPNALEELKKAGLSECIETVEIVREDIVAELYAAGKINKRLMKKLFGNVSTFAFSVDVKKRFADPDEEETK